VRAQIDPGRHPQRRAVCQRDLDCCLGRLWRWLGQPRQSSPGRTC
jgi:hypothetical protein